MSHEEALIALFGKMKISNSENEKTEKEKTSECSNEKKSSLMNAMKNKASLQKYFKNLETKFSKDSEENEEECIFDL